MKDSYRVVRLGGGGEVTERSNIMKNERVQTTLFLLPKQVVITLQSHEKEKFMTDGWKISYSFNITFSPT